jgi:nicotinate-nucleotide adenylyltransferase
VRYCIFGGSFDPPHAGHRYLARSARDACRLDKVLWVPAPDPPHKDKPLTPFRHRLAMVELAIALEKGQEASGIEATLPSPSYSLTTIRALKDAFGAGHEWHFLIGADNWEIIRTWHRWEEVLEEVTFIVFPRGGRSLKDLPAGVLSLDLPEMDLESRNVRQALSEGKDWEAAGVLPELRGYISAHGLYGAGKPS